MIDTVAVFDTLKSRLLSSSYAPYIDDLLQKNSHLIHREIDSVYHRISSSRMKEKGMYQFGGRTFTVDPDVKPDNVMVYVTRYPTNMEIVLINSVEEIGESMRFSRIGNRPVERYRLSVSELGLDGWTGRGHKLAVDLNNETDFQTRETGIYPFSIVYPGMSPLYVILQEKEKKARRIRLAQEDLIEKNQEAIKRQKEGVWLSEIVSSIGNVSDTIIASALRTWFKKNSDISPREMGLLSSMGRTGAEDSFIFYPYANQLAKIMAERYLKKNPDARAKIPQQILQKKASVKKLFSFADPEVVPWQVYFYFGADLFERLGIVEANRNSIKKFRLRELAAISQLALKFRQVAAGVIPKPDDLVRWATRQVNALGSNNAFPYNALQVAGCIMKQGPSTLPKCMQMASEKMNEYTPLGFDAAWQMGRLAYIKSLWSAGGERGLQLLLDGIPPIEENPTLMGGIEG